MLTKPEINKINKAISAVEKTTRGEVVPMIARQASSYPAAYLRASVLTLLGISLFYITSDLGHWGSVQGLLMVQMTALLILAFVLQFFPKLKLYFLSKAEVQEEIDEAALMAFYKYGVHRTREGTGILIAIFMNERRVKILGDYGIHKKAGQSSWDSLVAGMIQKIKNQGLSSGMVWGLSESSKVLQKKFPARKNNRNELKDRLILEL